jgi:hypothetical protein
MWLLSLKIWWLLQLALGFFFFLWATVPKFSPKKLHASTNDWSKWFAISSLLPLESQFHVYEWGMGKSTATILYVRFIVEGQNKISCCSNKCNSISIHTPCLEFGPLLLFTISNIWCKLFPHPHPLTWKIGWYKVRVCWNADILGQPLWPG